MVPTWSQKGHGATKRGPKMVPEGAGCTQGDPPGPRCGQEEPRWRPRGAKVQPKGAKQSPKEPQDGPKVRPRGPKRSPGCAQGRPRGAQVEPKGAKIEAKEGSGAENEGIANHWFFLGKTTIWSLGRPQ